MNRKFKEAATTALVVEVLRAADDFLNRHMIQRLINRGSSPVSGALHQLHKRRVVDVVIDEDGVGWWFALPVDLDTRRWHLEEHVPYATGFTRNGRRKKARAREVGS